MRITNSKTIYDRDNIKISFCTRNHASSGAIDCSGTENLDYAVTVEIDGIGIDIENDILDTYEEAEKRAWELVEEYA